MKKIVLLGPLEEEIRKVIEELNKENEIIQAIHTTDRLPILKNKTAYYYSAKRLKKIADRLMHIDDYLSLSPSH